MTKHTRNNGRSTYGGPVNAHARWTSREEESLKAMFGDGKTVAELAVIHGRSTNAVRLRLERIGLIEPSGTAAAAPPPAEIATARAHLSVDLVPASCWFSNVRSAVSAADWAKIREPVIRGARGHCAFCKRDLVPSATECHEIWHFDEGRGMQSLSSMVGLCRPCHEVQHLGFATANGRRSIAEAHLANVNGWTDEQARAHVEQAFAVWERRSQREWDLDLTALDQYDVRPVVRKRVAVTTPKTARPGRSRSITPISLEANYERLERRGLRIPVPLRMRGLHSVRLAWPTVVVALLQRRNGSAVAPADRTPERGPIVAAYESDRAQWVSVGTLRFWWDGTAWSGHYAPVSVKSGWWRDPYGPGIRWWSGARWTEHALLHDCGWVPQRPGATRLLWWSGVEFVESLKPLPTGRKVRPRDRNNIGKVVGVNVTQREKPIRVYFRNKRTQQWTTADFAPKDLRTH